MKDLEKRYQRALEIAKSDFYSFPIHADSFVLPSFLNDKTKYKRIDGFNLIFPYELTEKATDEDKEEYIKHVIDSVGYKLSDL